MKKLNSSLFNKNEIIEKSKSKGVLGGEAVASTDKNDTIYHGLTDQIHWTVWDVDKTVKTDDTPA